MQQTIAVNEALNFKAAYDSKAHYVHQAGAYQRDAPNTDVPFYSPTLAKHCSGDACYFASWGTHAHVQTPFTSSILYINKYTNCGQGIIEHTQMAHNFADPMGSDPNNVDHTYFNVGWGVSAYELQRSKPETNISCTLCVHQPGCADECTTNSS